MDAGEKDLGVPNLPHPSTKVPGSKPGLLFLSQIYYYLTVRYHGEETLHGVSFSEKEWDQV